ncbi:DUF1559 family PulG-like putative transporter [Planctomicrobium piriforme]|uniref:DUF1559 domain-containing protein n=1 Tax=Planctomicrobium piriforme TaxID=1576369 RepID=A0A1I3AYH5_9PLAN|nr:DUF1559 domain-containing protein [Planctomicrobium piriforme]SFH54431.1 Protein of unknown function [Planctomicrobium piriforme]
MTESSDHELEADKEHWKPERSWGRFFLEYGVVAIVILILVALLLPASQSSTGSRPRSPCKNNLKQIALAIYNYSDMYGSLPPAYTVDAEGKPLHSWRTLLLPFLDQQELYDKIDLSKPWDDPANEIARNTVVRHFHCLDTKISPTQTTYLAMVGDEFCFHPTRGRRWSEIKDGMSNTVMIFETNAKHSVHWMSPTDGDPEWFLTFKEQGDFSHTGGTHIGIGDGSVRLISVSMPTTTRKALMTIAGGEEVGEY